MRKDLTTSGLDRQNILNNQIAIDEMNNRIDIRSVTCGNEIYITKEDVAEFYEVDVRTITRYIENYSDELRNNGYQVLKGKKLKEFLEVYKKNFAKDMNVPSKITQLGVFDFRSFLNIGMLLSESIKARQIRELILDIAIDVINEKTGGNTKYINKRDKDFLFSSFQEDNYRRIFTDALRDYVVDDKYKYAKFTNMIYVSIFKENANEYKKILDLKASDKVRETFYSEILDIISSYENGLAEEIKNKSEIQGRRLTIKETEVIFSDFEKMPLWKPLIEKGRVKMSSRDMALRDAFHYQLSEYIQPLNQEEFDKFLGEKSDEFEKLLRENQDVLMRLRDRN
jgi:ciab protein